MAKTLGMLFGIVFLAVGILGFVPGVTSDVNGMPMLLAIFLFAAMSSAGAARLWFQTFGGIYAIVAVLGFMNPAGPLLGMISNNPPVTYLHVILAAAMLLIGFATPKQTA